MRRLTSAFALAAAAAVIATAAAPAPAVIGGRAASQPYPFMAALRDGGDQFCGASLLTPTMALTAAHCVPDGQAGGLDVLLNQPRLSGSGGEAIPVAAVEVHENYKGSPDGGSDIALLTLSEPSTMAPVRLAGPAEHGLWEPGDVMRVIGWGSSVYLVGPGYDDLQEVDIPITSDADCEASYPEFDQSTMVCAGDNSGLRDSCQGDSGGPMFAFDAAGAPVQVGVVSYGIGCGFPGGFYGVYGRVADPTLRGWIAARVPGLDAAAPAPGATPVPTPPPNSSPGAPTPAAPVTRLRYAQNLGSARLARRRHRVRLRIQATGPVRDLVGTLRPAAGGRTIATVRRSRVDGRAVLVLKLKRRARAASGPYRLSLRGTDALGKRVSVTGVAFLRR